MNDTPESLRQAAAEIAALDAKRTQGDWYCHNALLSVYTSHGDGGCVADAETPADSIRRRENMEFIAAAPRMASLIAAQAERIRQLEEGRAEREKKISKEFDAFREFTDAQHALVAELRATIARLEERVGADGYCAFCETVIPAMPGFLLSHVMRGHVESCPKHPLAQALAKIAELEQQLGECSGEFDTQGKETAGLLSAYERLCTYSNSTDAQLFQQRAQVIGLTTEADSLRATLASQAAEIEGLRIRARLHDSLERAAGELPEGCIIELCVENGAGYVQLNYSDEFVRGNGFTAAIESADRSLSEQVDEAIRAALAAKGSGT